MQTSIIRMRARAPNEHRQRDALKQSILGQLARDVNPAAPLARANATHITGQWIITSLEWPWNNLQCAYRRMALARLYTFCAFWWARYDLFLLMCTKKKVNKYFREFWFYLPNSNVLRAKYKRGWKTAQLWHNRLFENRLFCTRRLKTSYAFNK